MRAPPRRARALVPLAAAALLAGACDRSPEEPAPGSTLQIREVVLTDGAGAVLVYSHDDHWHGFVRVARGGRQDVRAYFSAQELGTSHDAPTERFTLEGHADHALRVTSAVPAVATWEGDRFALVVRGLAAGSAGASFVVRRGSTTVFEAPPATVLVAE